jgi:hypothetical protein
MLEKSILISPGIYAWVGLSITIKDRGKVLHVGEARKWDFIPVPKV